MQSRTRTVSCLIDRYREYLPVEPGVEPVTLGEGSTPLVPSRVIGPELGLDLWLKVEGRNPTGSFKDRGMTVAVTRARSRGARAVVCASTGNTAASAAAYAARAGLTAVVLVPQGGVAQGKLAQAVAFGAEIWEVAGNFDHVLSLVRQAVEQAEGVALVNSVNPDRLAGQKTAVYEILDSFPGEPPASIVMPVGNAGNISAYGMGLEDYRQAGRCTDVPRLIGVQAEGAAPMLSGTPVLAPRTVASAIRIGNPASAALARQAVERTDGAFIAVPDEAILEAQRRLAAEEGIFVEPASASPVAALLEGARRRHAEGADPVIARAGGRVVCVLTGDGLKDPEAGARLGRPIVPFRGDPLALQRELARVAGGGGSG